MTGANTRTHNNAALHWFGEHGKRYGYRNTPLGSDSKVKIMGEHFFDDGQGINREKFLRFIEKYVEAYENGEYINAHNW